MPTVNTPESKTETTEDPEQSATSLGGFALRILLGAALTVAVVAAYVLLSDKAPRITAEVDPISTFFIHREMTPQSAGGGMVGVHQPFDQVLILANVHVHNESKIPIFIHDEWSTVSLPDMDRRGLAAGDNDFARVFVAYPQMASLKKEPLKRDTTIAPHSSAEGQMVFNFPLTKEEWDARHAYQITLSFTHQKDLTISVPK